MSILQPSDSVEHILDLALWKRLNGRPQFIFAVPFILLLSLFSCHLYLCFCFSDLRSPNIFNLYWYGRISMTLIIFVAHLWNFYSSVTSFWKWCDPNWIGHLILFYVLSSPLKYILNLVFLLSLVARKRCIQLGRDCLFWMGRFIFPWKDFGHVTWNQVEDSASSLQVLYQLWKYKFLLNNVLFIMHSAINRVKSLKIA